MERAQTLIQNKESHFKLMFEMAFFTSTIGNLIMDIPLYLHSLLSYFLLLS